MDDTKNHRTDRLSDTWERNVRVTETLDSLIERADHLAGRCDEQTAQVISRAKDALCAIKRSARWDRRHRRNYRPVARC